MNWTHLFAQCVMCYRTAAAQQAERSRVFNSGILVLLIPPILLLAVLLFLTWRKSGDPAQRPVATNNNATPGELPSPGAAS